MYRFSNPSIRNSLFCVRILCDGWNSKYCPDVKCFRRLINSESVVEILTYMSSLCMDKPPHNVPITVKDTHNITRFIYNIQTEEDIIRDVNLTALPFIVSLDNVLLEKLLFLNINGIHNRLISLGMHVHSFKDRLFEYIRTGELLIQYMGLMRSDDLVVLLNNCLNDNNREMFALTVLKNPIYYPSIIPSLLQYTKNANLDICFELYRYPPEVTEEYIDSLTNERTRAWFRGKTNNLGIDTDITDLYIDLSTLAKQGKVLSTKDVDMITYKVYEMGIHLPENDAKLLLRLTTFMLNRRLLEPSIGLKI